MMKPKILLIGDDCVDVYQYGLVDRISPEAPVPVFRYLEQQSLPGMAANVKTNLEKLDAEVVYLHSETSIKTRLIDRRSGQHIVRVDDDKISQPIKSSDLSELNFDAIVISDYNKGTVSYELVEHLRSVYNGPIFVDTKKIDLARFEGCYVKINSKEYAEAKTYCTNLIVTKGDQGASYRNNIWPAVSVPVSDVTGAGDTFLAALAVNYVLYKDINRAIAFAIAASAVTVQHLGVYAPTMEEILCG